MKRSQSLVFRLLIAAFAVAFLGSVTARLQAQARPPLRCESGSGCCRRRGSLRCGTSYSAAPGMTGSTTNDPRVGLKPGLYDAGEAAMGMKHIAFLKKPTAFQLSSTQADDPVVQKTLDTLGVNKAKISKTHATGHRAASVCELRFCVSGNSPVPGQLLRREHLRYLEPGEHIVGYVSGLPRRPRRSLRL